MVAGVVDAVVLGGEGNVIAHAKLSDGAGAVLVGPLVELIGKRDEQGKGNNEEVEGHRGDTAAADGHEGNNS